MRDIIGAREMQTTNIGDLPDYAESLGARHAPITHRQFAGAMRDAIDRVGLSVREQQFVVDGVRNMSRGGNYGEVTIPGANIFALFRVGHPTREIPGGDFLIGARNSVAQALAAQACIGVHFSICTNVSLFGHDLLFKRKNTTLADIQALARETVAERCLPMMETVEEQIARLQGISLTKVQREAAMLRLFEKQSLPTKYLRPLAEVVRLAEAGADEAAPEVTENLGNALGLMHASTRVIQAEGNLRRLGELSQNVSRFFGFGVQQAA